jgi:transglutaminase-like putative cysteine protease
MRYRIVHRTDYRYEQPVTLCHNEAHLQPRANGRQSCLRHELQVDPPVAVSSQREDFFGNPVHYFAIQQQHELLSVVSVSEVQIAPEPVQLHFQSSSDWAEVPERLANERTPANVDARQYVLASPLVRSWPQLAAYAAESFAPGRSLVEAVHDLMQRIHHEFAYDPGVTTVTTPIETVFEQRRGVCQDFAHLAIACLRSLSLPARYVSGYIETLPPPGQEKLVGSDASHAWFSVYDPEVGWLDFDPTNNQIPMDQHITTAWGRDYSDITPLKGVIFGGGASHSTDVAVDVQRLD